MINIAIADDHTLIRKGIVEIISSFKQYKVIIEAGNGAELLSAINESDQMPDICILDISMPVMNGYETLLIIKRTWPEMKVLVLTMFNNEFSILKMVLGGAKGYLLKDCTPAELELALNNLYRYNLHHSELVPEEMFDKEKYKHLKPHQKITDKELLFLKYCCTELHYREIAELMEVSVRTVHAYRDSLFDKLGLKTRIGLVMYATSIGVIPIEQHKIIKKPKPVDGDEDSLSEP